MRIQEYGLESSDQPGSKAPEQFDETIAIKIKKYKHERELHRSQSSIVYLYKEINGKSQIIVKAARDNNPNSHQQNDQEMRNYKELLFHDLNCMPKVYGGGNFGPNPYMNLEYIDMSILEYLRRKDIPNKLSFQEICL